ncbi:MAG TPA: hypothetical protein VNA19_04795, partial [Pyrinomonadaceae bacterium]|nr:hypothetical protein [Pyrinomonadaceae bacterium]
IFINTSGVGIIESDIRLSASGAQVGDKVVLSGMIGDHGTTIMIARGELELETGIESDSALLVARMRRNPYGHDACIIGEVKRDPRHRRHAHRLRRNPHR